MIKICLGVASILIIFTYILNKKSYDFEKLSQYECGIEPFDENISNYNLYNINITETREKFYLKFYIIGIIFLIFDLESILLYPIVFSPVLINNPKIDISVPIWGGEEIYLGYLIFIIFMFFLIIGLIYEYKKKVLI